MIAKAAADGGADAVSAVNTFVGMAVDWRRRKPILGNVTGGLSGPAIKPLALRAVWRIAQLKAVPVIGVGGIATIDDVMEFLVAGATRGADRHRELLRPDGERAHRRCAARRPSRAGSERREGGGGDDEDELKGFRHGK